MITKKEWIYIYIINNPQKVKQLVKGEYQKYNLKHRGTKGYDE